MADNNETYKNLMAALDAVDACTIEMAELMRRKNLALKNSSILAANYFTKDKIAELYMESINVLKCNCFDEGLYIQKFSDSSTIEYQMVKFLVDLQATIEDIKLQTNQLPAPQKEKKKFLERCADNILGGDANND